MSIINDDDNKVVTIKNLNLRGMSDIILDDISFEIKKGDFFGIIGPNGAGKTTLFKCMLGLNKNYSGTIRIFNKEIKKDSKEIYKKIGYIPQTNTFNPRFPATVKEIIELGSIGKKISKDKIDE